MFSASTSATVKVPAFCHRAGKQSSPVAVCGEPTAGSAAAANVRRAATPGQASCRRTPMFGSVGRGSLRAGCDRHRHFVVRPAQIHRQTRPVSAAPWPKTPGALPTFSMAAAGGSKRAVKIGI